ncbi:MAG: glycoside hydrolase family 92 protein, partial [Chlorobi bacterium]|nr:glycoside hydrolase family 92 protein [Chlorobiota bacterium]
MKSKLIFIAAFLFSLSIYAQKEGFDYVNPFIGTGGHGHTYPGASLPFGMIQLSPDTDNKGWDWCSGYHYTDSTIMGFSHTHLSGTGIGDYGDILFMPVNGNQGSYPGSKFNPDGGYRSRFSHKDEYAEPGYYSVYLKDYGVKAELTVSERCGFHRYTFDQVKGNGLIIDLNHGISDETVESYVKIIGKNKIVGYRKSKGWAKNQTVYFAASFLQPFKD